MRSNASPRQHQQQMGAAFEGFKSRTKRVTVGLMSSGARGPPAKKPVWAPSHQKPKPSAETATSRELWCKFASNRHRRPPSFRIYIWMAYYLKPCLSKEVRLVNKTTFQTTLAPVWTSLLRENKKPLPLMIMSRKRGAPSRWRQSSIISGSCHYDSKLFFKTFQRCSGEQRHIFIFSSLLLDVCARQPIKMIPLASWWQKFRLGPAALFSH